MIFSNDFLNAKIIHKISKNKTKMTFVSLNAHKFLF